MKCGMPSEWASARAPSTASGEQQALAPSVSGSAQSLTVTADHLRPALALEQRRDGAVDAAGHGDRDALGSRRLGDARQKARRRRRRRAARARCRASAASCGGVALGRGEAAERRVDRRRCRCGAASSTGAPSTISATAAVAARVAPQPSASKLDRGDPAVLDRSEIRERSPQAAPPAAPVKAPSAGGPAPALVAQVVLEELPIHVQG